MTLGNAPPLDGVPALLRSSWYSGVVKVVAVAVGLLALGCEPCPEGYAEAGPGSCARFVPGPTMLHVRRDHTATRLLDGRVLFVGGEHDGALQVGDPNDTPYTAEIYDPVSAEFVEAARPLRGRSRHAALLLADGRVFVSGGSTNDGQDDSGHPCEIYDPASDSWSDAPPHIEALGGHVLVATPAGRLVAANNLRTEVLEPGASVWTSAPATPTGFPQSASVQLRDGRLAMLGGYPGSTIVEILDLESLIWQSAAPMSVGRFGVTAAVLEDGRVLAVGGEMEDLQSYGPNELYDPAADRWTALPAAHRPREELAATLLPDGVVLLTGGFRPWAPVAEVELFLPEVGKLAVTASLAAARNAHSAVAMDDGRVLIAGGAVEGEGGADDLETEIFERR